MRVCVAGSYDPGFARNRKLLRALALQGMEVRQHRIRIWDDDRVGIAESGKLRALFRGLIAYPRLLGRLLRTERPDVFLVLYPGWFDVPVVWLAGRLRGVPLVFDIFISLHDTVVVDRRLVPPGSMVARLCALADRWSCRLAQRVIADTPAHADFHARHTGVRRDRFGVVWLGAMDDIFAPQAGVSPEPRLVVFHGTFVPLQGLETIVRAAGLLEGQGVTFELVGDGQERPMVEALMAELGVTNVRLVGLVPVVEVPRRVARATLCLGIFGTTPKAARVVPNKVFECLAVGRPVVTGDTPAVRSAFGPDEVALSPVGQPEELAATIRRLLEDAEGREAMALRGHRRYDEDYSEEPLSRLLAEELRAVASRVPQPRR